MSTLKGSRINGFIDGAAAKVTFGATSQNFGSSGAGNTIVAMFSIVSSDNIPVTIVSITDNAGMAWHKGIAHSHAGLNQSGITAGPVSQNLEIWYAQKPVGSLPTSGYDFTVTVNDDNVDSFFWDMSPCGVFDMNNPLDFNANAKGSADFYNSGSTSALNMTLSTDTATQTVFSCWGGVGPGQRPMNSGNPKFNGTGHTDYGTGSDIFHLNANYNVVATDAYDTTSAWASATLENTDAINNPIGIFITLTQIDQSSTSYSNFLGTGDRRAAHGINIFSELGVSTSDDSNSGSDNFEDRMLDGTQSAIGHGAFFNGTLAIAGKVVFQIDFLSAPRCVDEIKWYKNTSSNHEVMQWYGSNDGYNTSDALGDPCSFDGATPLFHLGGNTTAYQSYRLLGVSGNIHTGNNGQVEFKIDNAVGSGGQYVHATAAVTSFNNQNTKTIAITTTIDAWLVLIIESNQRTSVGHPAVSSVTDDNSNTWTLRSSHEATIKGNAAADCYQFVEYWYARQPTGDTTTITVNTSSNVDSANLHVIAFANLPDMSTLWQTTTATEYDFAGSATIPSMNYPDITGKGLAIVSAVTALNSGVMQADNGWDQRGHNLLHPRNGGNFNWAYGNHSLHIIEDTSSDPILFRGTSTSLLIFSDVINIDSGGGGADGNANGTTMTVTWSLIPGTAFVPLDGNAAGVTLTNTWSFFPGSASDATEIDGSFIWEMTFNAINNQRYQEADYYSIFSVGDRNRNGLINAIRFGVGAADFIIPAGMIDNNYAHALGSGWVPQAQNPQPYGGAHLDFGPNKVTIAAFKCIGSNQYDDTDQHDDFTFKVGFDAANILPDSYAKEFDAFRPSQLTFDASLNMFYTEFVTTPRVAAEWSFYEFAYFPIPSVSHSDMFAEDLEIKIFHSMLDGGDRRTTNGNPNKRTAFSMSTHWSANPGSGHVVAPSSAWFDGSILRGNSPNGTSNTDYSIVGTAANSGIAVTTVGAYFQFVFPRIVIPLHFLMQVENREVYDSGGDPTIYGKWHWEYSLNGGVSYTPIGNTWWFKENCDYCLAPNTGETFGLKGVPGIGDGATHWRMVLDAGPAFGNHSIYEVMFNLHDIGDQTVAFEAFFSDDVDGALPVVSITSLSPFFVQFSDGADDKIGGTFTNTPNPLLSAFFTDESTMTFRASFEPSTYVQTVVVMTGKP